MHEHNVAHRYRLHCITASKLLISFAGIAHWKTSCLTRRGCILSHSTPWTSGVERTFVERRKDSQGLGVLHNTFLSTLAYLGYMIRLMDLLLTTPSVVATSRHLSTKTERRLAIRSQQTYTTSET
jgi:hypothetical protein